MKKIFFVLILVVMVNTVVFSQNTENENVERKFTIQTSPGLFLIDLIRFGIDIEAPFFIMDIEGQYKINDMFNVSLTLSFLVDNITLYGTIYYYDPIYYTENYSYEEKVFQVNLKPMFIYRPFQTGLKGFYIGFYPNIGWQSLNSSKYEDGSWTEIGFGINTGYKWIFNSGFTLQLGAGIGKTWSIPKKPDSTTYYYSINSDGRITLKNFDLLIIDLKLGYSF
jgi:hypothetical protein